jgi:hypothetical protein
MALVLLTILPPAGAAAQGNDPAVGQYVESVPSTDGDRAPNNEPRSGGGDLPSGVSREIQREGGEDAEALEAVGTSPALGAPEKDGERRDGAGSSDVSTSDPSAVRAVASAAGGDGGASGWLLGGLVLLTAVLAGTALARKRSLS